MFGRARFALAFAFALLAPQPSAAEPTATPSAAERETARRQMEDGRARTKAGDLEGAIDAFRKAHNIMRVPTTGYALAKAYLDHGDLVQARDAAIDAYRVPVDPREPPVFAEARRRAQELEASVKPRIPTLKITVKNGGGDAEFQLDGQTLPRSLLNVPSAFNPGRHAIRVASGGATRTIEVVLAEGEAKEVAIEVPQGRGPIGAEEKKTSLHVDDSSTNHTLSMLVPIGLGTAALGVTVGAVTGIVALRKSSDVREHCIESRCDPVVEEDIDSARAMAVASTISWVVAAGGGVLALVGWFGAAKSDPRDKRAGHVEPWIGAGLAGARGSF